MFFLTSRLGFGPALASVLFSSAHAALIGGADFESPAYTAGTLPGQINWTGSTAWVVGAGGLSNSVVAGGGQHAQITGSASVGTNGEIARLSFPEQSGTVYARFNLRYEGAADSADFFWAALGKSGGINAYDSSLGLVLRNETGGWGLQVRARDASTAVNGPVPARAFRFYTTLAILLKAEKSGASGANYDRISLWVNPVLASGSSESAAGTPDATVTRSTGRPGIDQLFFRLGDAGALDVGERILIDAIQVGSTWADVLSANSGVNLPVSGNSFSTRPSIISGVDDFDGDSQPDLLERALGSAPDVGAVSVAPVFSSIEIADNALDVTYERSAVSGRFVPVVESSVDLISWSEANVSQTHFQQMLQDGRVQITARIQPRAVRQFARLRARDLQQIDTLTPEATRDLFARLLLYWGSKVNTTGTRDTYGSTYSYEWVMRMVTPMAAWLSQPGRAGTLSVGGSTINVAEALRRALVNGTDPSEATRWPLPVDQADQIVVEAQQPAFAAWLLKDANTRPGAPGAAVWNGFTATQRSNLASFLAATGSPSFSYTNNWNLFVTVNQEARKRLALAGVTEFSGYSQSAINSGLAKIQDMHRGGGWYADSSTEHIFDDYIPYVILPEQMNHFIMGRADTQAQSTIPGTNGRGRAEILADVSAWLAFHVRTFDATGGNPEYGRSSSYKFSRLRPLLQAYYIDQVLNTPTGWNLGFKVLPAEITPGMLRRLVRLHLNHYLANGSIDPATFALRNGQSADSSTEIKEVYTHDGSVYWAMNAFTALFMLPDSDPFWTAVEEPLPSERIAGEYWYEHPGFLLRSLPAQGHVELFNMRVIKNAWMGDEYYNKYTKFAYSSRFGYCTKSGSRLDQNIMIGSGYRQNPLSGDYYLPPGHVLGEPGVLRTTHAQGTATIKTLIFLRAGAQVRVHRVINASGLRIRDGGYALGHSTGVTPPVAQTGADWIYMESTEVGAELVARLLGHTSVASVSGTGNHSRQAQWRLPYAETASAGGSTFHTATLVFASSVRFDPVTARAKVGGVVVNGNTATVTWGDGSVVSADFP